MFLDEFGFCFQEPVARTRAPRGKRPILRRVENVKAHLKNATPATVTEIGVMLDRGFARLRRRPDLLYHFIRHAGFVVKQLW